MLIKHIMSESGGFSIGKLFEEIIEDVFIFIILAVLIFIASSYAASSAATMNSQDIKNNPKLDSAHDKLTWSSIIGFITFGIIVIIIIGIILLLIVGVEGLDIAFIPFIKYGIVIANLLLVGVLLVMGVLNLLAVLEIGEITPSSIANHKKIFNDALIATILSFGLIVLIGLYFVFKFLYGKHKKAEEADKKKEKSEEYIHNLERLKAEGIPVTAQASLTQAPMARTATNQPLINPQTVQTVLNSPQVSRLLNNLNLI